MTGAKINQRIKIGLGILAVGLCTYSLYSAKLDLLPSKNLGALNLSSYDPKNVGTVPLKEALTICHSASFNPFGNEPESVCTEKNPVTPPSPLDTIGNGATEMDDRDLEEQLALLAKGDVRAASNVLYVSTTCGFNLEARDVPAQLPCAKALLAKEKAIKLIERLADSHDPQSQFELSKWVSLKAQMSAYSVTETSEVEAGLNRKRASELLDLAVANGNTDAIMTKSIFEELKSELKNIQNPPL